MLLILKPVITGKTKRAPPLNIHKISYVSKLSAELRSKLRSKRLEK
jgi:hypothetical protein